ncbi:MAG: DUF1203 domain-containing protein [Pseudomonadota bacterium]
MRHRYLPLPTEDVRRLQRGGLDAYGMAPERAVSDGKGNPCRHCLCEIPKGAEMLILAHRPFPAPQAYAETGPIFLCAEPCQPWQGAGVPPVLTTSPDYLVKGYGPDYRIRYGTGAVVPAGEIDRYVGQLLAKPGIAFADIRSARNNCFQCRVACA